MKRSKFNLSHTQLTSSTMGRIIPIGLLEVLPGDTIQHAAQALIRAAPLATPPMHPVRIDVRHFFVPHRLVWDNWEKFITGGPDGLDASVYPTMSYDVERGDTLDHLGIYPNSGDVVADWQYSALPLRGLNLIYNEFYRDQDLQPELAISKADGPDTITAHVNLRANWEKDYFTTARPFEQKGPDVTLGIGGNATGTALITQGGPVSDPSTLFGLVRGEADSSGHATVDMLTGTMSVGTPIQLTGNVDVDLSTASAITVNDLRFALGLQRLQEARARYGSRYTEYLAYLGVRSSDARLQRPEYLGGSRTSLQFSEVLSTSVAQGPDGNSSAIPGNFGGHGIGANRTNRYRKFFEEHGFIFSVMVVQPQTMYPSGMFRHWNRRTKEDFFQRELQHIGQQAILNREVHGLHVDPNDTFGYQDRYDEYRRSESQTHGQFRPGGYLEDWSFARDLDTNVALNSDFVTSNPTKAPFQVWNIGAEEADTLYIAVKHQIVARRILAAKGSSFIL